MTAYGEHSREGPPMGGVRFVRHHEPGPEAVRDAEAPRADSIKRFRRVGRSVRQLSTRLAYQNPWLSIREDRVEHADGSEGIFGVLEKRDFALVIPIESNGAIWLVEQYRYPVGARFWEFPQGSGRGEDPAQGADLARAELAEETGLRAGGITHLGHLYEAYGYAAHGFDVWIATDLKLGLHDREPSEQDMRTGLFPPDAVARMLRNGQIKDAPSVAAYGMWMLGLGASGSR